MDFNADAFGGMTDEERRRLAEAEMNAPTGPSGMDRAGGALKGGLSGAATGSVFGPWGTAIGGAVGALGGALMAEPSGDGVRPAPNNMARDAEKLATSLTKDETSKPDKQGKPGTWAGLGGLEGKEDYDYWFPQDLA